MWTNTNGGYIPEYIYIRNEMIKEEKVQIGKHTQSGNILLGMDATDVV